jgi:hypothetical protein
MLYPLSYGSGTCARSSARKSTPILRLVPGMFEPREDARTRLQINQNVPMSSSTSPASPDIPSLQIRDIVIDCLDAERLAAFWGRLLNRSVSARIGPYVWLERRDTVSLGFQTVTEPKRCKNRLHIDLGAANPLNERRHVEALGGRRVGGYDGGGFLVMADPEGNEFCIVPNRPFEVTDQGCTNYLTQDDGTPSNA